MKTIIKALVWSVVFELLLLLPVILDSYAPLSSLAYLVGILSYLTLSCHAPAMRLLAHWPSAQENLIVPALVQWLIWFVMFEAIFTLAGWFHRYRTARKGKEVSSAQ